MVVLKRPELRELVLLPRSVVGPKGDVEPTWVPADG